MNRREFFSLIASAPVYLTASGSVSGEYRYQSQDQQGRGWRTFGYDRRNTSYRPISGPTEGVEVEWSYETDGRILSSPAVADSSVYFGSWDGIMYSLDAQTGAQNWSFQTGERKPVYRFEDVSPFPENGGIGSSPSLHEGMLYFGAYDGYLYCLDSQTGVLEWRYETDSIIRSSPVVVDETVYVGDWTGKMHALNAETGEHEWGYDTEDDHIYSTPCFADGTVYFGSVTFGEDDGTGAVYALDRDGDRLWKKETEAVVGSSPCTVDDTVFFGSFDGKVRAVDADDGAERWSYTAEAGFGSSPATDGESLYIAGNDRNVYSLDTGSGDLNWAFEADAKFYASNVSVTDDAVFVGGHDQKMYALRSSDGKPLWSFETGDDIRSMPAVFEDKIYFGGQDGVFYSLSESPSENRHAMSEPTSGGGIEEFIRMLYKRWGR